MAVTTLSNQSITKSIDLFFFKFKVTSRHCTDESDLTHAIVVL